VFDAGTAVTPELLRERGIVRETGALIKILGRGECEKALTVRAHKFSESASKKLVAAGGVAEVIS
jgi:large subunit ribosomal protein L15